MKETTHYKIRCRQTGRFSNMGHWSAQGKTFTSAESCRRHSAQMPANLYANAEIVRVHTVTYESISTVGPVVRAAAA